MSENNQSKRSRCRYCFPSMRKNGKEFHCVVDGWEDENVKNISRKDCESCSKFSSRYIEYPITVNGIESEEIKPHTLGYECGTLCESGLAEKSMRIGLIWVYILGNCQLVYLHHMIQIQVFLRIEPLIILQSLCPNLRKLYMDVKAGGAKLNQQKM